MTKSNTKVLLIATSVTLLVGWTISWLMVFKFGYRHEAWFGIGKAFYDESESFAILIGLITAGIASFIAPLLVLSGLLISSDYDE